jgi:hypothetical protein|tara:strand:+ start:261 stop:653 length:393 start_codon:yes stop_codon:yes gene_type:complete
MAEEMMNQQMGGGVMAPPPENVSDVGDTQPMQTQQTSQEQMLNRGREILMNRVEQLSPEEKTILANSITPEFTQVVTKIFGPAVNDFLEILTVESPNQESAPTQTEPMVAQGEGMMMNRPPVQETAPAQV